VGTRELLKIIAEVLLQRAAMLALQALQALY